MRVPLLILLKESFPPIFDMGNGFEERKSNFFSIQKVMDKKNPSSRFNHLSTRSAFILRSNIGISKWICTLKGEVPPFEEDVSPLVDAEGFARNYTSSHSSVV
jgi:hypothetical protein